MLGDRFKGSLRCTLRQTALRAGIRARFDLLSRLIAALSSLRQAGAWVRAHGQHLFLAVPFVSESPPFRPVRLHKQAQSASIGELVGPIPCSRVANGNIRQPLNAGRASGIAVGNGFQGSSPCFDRDPSYPEIYPLPNSASDGKRSVRLRSTEKRKLNTEQALTRENEMGWIGMRGAETRRMVPGRGLEPPRCYPLVPETSASTNSATRAGQRRRRNLRRAPGAVN